MDAMIPLVQSLRTVGAAAPPTGAAEAARELEVTFLTQLLGAMRRTIPRNELLPRSPERDVYEGAFDRLVAESLSLGDRLGLVSGPGAGQLKVPAQLADTVSGQPLRVAQDRGPGGSNR